jgi:uncharacterized protein (DUF427 family)
MFMEPLVIGEYAGMRAVVDAHVVAESDDIVEAAGYQYFPRSAVRMEWLEKAERTADDLECPHSVQFYDVVIDGKRHSRAAWSYEDPLPRMQRVAGRFGFWQDVEVG